MISVMYSKLSSDLKLQENRVKSTDQNDVFIFFGFCLKTLKLCWISHLSVSVIIPAYCLCVLCVGACMHVCVNQQHD